jgi:DNA-binding IscR family transcriptional regulator
LYLLAWGGFVSSRRGSKGGFWLRRAPGRIRIGEVVKFLSSPVDLSHELSNDPVLRVWRKTAASSYEAFKRLSVGDLATQFSGSAASPERKVTRVVLK